uniref:PDEase domain-containing protein n=1 Tax=Romanomermis culicivorax TaxID=13658 RepID=A0A915IR00_ROMCU
MCFISSVGFIEYVVLPLWESWAELVHPAAESILENLNNNKRWYSEKIPLDEDPSEEEKKSAAPSGGPS